MIYFLIIIFFVFGQGLDPNSSESSDLKLIGTIPLADVSGRIDHMAYNDSQDLLYVAALGNNTVEVVDLRSKKVIYSIKGLSEPQGIRYIHMTNSIVVSNGGNGELKIFKASDYKEVKSINLGEDADNVKYNPANETIYVGYGSGAIAMVNAITLEEISEIGLPGHPESFQLDNDNRLYVNIPDMHLLDVVDLKLNKVIAKWEIRESSANFPMALDEADNRLFIGCRHPAKLLVLDIKTEKTITSLPVDGDADDIFYDNSTHQIFMSCGSGYLDIFKQVDPDKYLRTGRIETSPGARTSLFITHPDRIIVAAPARSGKQAQLMVYGM
jgi:YVTN family beta-propeller protein